MNIYHNENHVVLHFGIGLIGSAVQELFAQSNSNAFKTLELPFQWEKIDLIQSQFIKIFNKTTELLYNNQKLTIVWSAGKAGFLATEDEVETELTFFSKVAEELKNFSVNKQKAHVILLSSGGGMYEGQSNIGWMTKTKPLRPYGQLKNDTEDILTSLQEHFLKVSIIRPSSIFSTRIYKGRKGLINTLIANIKSGTQTTIYGDPNTLRDYVLDFDVAEVILDLVMDRREDDSLLVVASGKPTSIKQIIQMIENHSGKHAQVRYTLKKSNTGNITYNANKIIKGRRSQELGSLICKSIYLT